MLFMMIVALVLSAHVEWVASAPSAGRPASWKMGALIAGAVAIIWVLSYLVAHRTVGGFRTGAGGAARRAVRYHRLLWGLRGLILGLYLVLIFEAGWPAFVYHTLRVPDWLVIDNWVMILPFVTMLLAHWIPIYRVDVLFRQRQASTAVLEPISGVPLEPFRPWSLGQYVGHHLRHYVLVVVVPVSVWWMGMDGASWLLWRYGVRGDGWHLASALVWVVGVYAVSPVFMRLIWDTRRLPDGRLRRRLDALCRSTGLRYREILIWRTHCDVVNAAVAGVLGRLRYVFLSDGLLRHMSIEEIEAVFAHEIGHVRHRHIPLYLVFATGSMVFFLVLVTVAAMVHGALGGSAQLLRDLESWPFPLAALGLYWGVLFGYLSRRFERQADVFAIRASADGGGRSPATWHPEPQPRALEGPADRGDPAHVLVPRPLDPVALGRFTRALEAVGRLNGMTRNVAGWSHFSISRRVHFLEQALVDPLVEWRFQRALRRLKWAWLTAALLGLAFIAWQYVAVSGQQAAVSTLNADRWTLTAPLTLSDRRPSSGASRTPPRPSWVR